MVLPALSAAASTHVPSLSAPLFWAPFFFIGRRCVHGLACALSSCLDTCAQLVGTFVLGALLFHRPSLCSWSCLRSQQLPRHMCPACRHLCSGRPSFSSAVAVFMVLPALSAAASTHVPSLSAPLFWA